MVSTTNDTNRQKFTGFAFRRHSRDCFRHDVRWRRVWSGFVWLGVRRVALVAADTARVLKQSNKAKRWD